MVWAGKGPADDLNFYSLLGILQCGMWLQADIEKYLNGSGLSHGRFSILLSLIESPDASLIGNELAGRLGVGKSTIAKMVEKLIEDKFVNYTLDESDLRKKKYALTKKAEKSLRAIVPGYLERLRAFGANLSAEEKKSLLAILGKIDFLDPNKRISPLPERSITDKCREIRELCRSGAADDIDQVLAYLDENVDLPTTKVVDYCLGTVDTIEGMKRIEYYLFGGTQIQRNYCTLFFARRNDWKLVNKAYRLGLIDYIQAYAR
jgi:DNA-binding MarR family transcriptional regulator